MAIVISLILLFLGISVLILIHICIVGNTLRRGLSERNVDVVERGSLGSTSMSRDDIEKLPCFDFKEKDKGSSPPADCAVCLENFRVGEKCRLLPSCNHSFHAECVDMWLLRAPVCPICRAGADCVSSGLLCGEEGDSFGESGVDFREGNEREIQIGGGRSGDSNCSFGGEMGLNQTLEIVVSSRNGFGGDQAREGLDSRRE